MQILNNKQIEQKIKRIAIEILEKNFEAKNIILVGINNNGYAFAQLLEQQLLIMSGIDIQLTRIRLNPASPLKEEISIETDIHSLKNEVVIIVDDVANTGRTIFFAIQPLLSIIPKKVEVAVLVDREHKSFPIFSNYIGLSLATTLNDNIEVDISNKNNKAVFLS